MTKKSPRSLTKRAEIKENNQLGYDTTTHANLLIKLIPDALIDLRRELTNHPDIMAELAKPQFNTFDICIGRIAQLLSIGLDGEYEPIDMFKMLTTALQNRNSLLPHTQAPGLKQVEFHESATEITLVDLAEELGLTSREHTGTGRYTICDGCRSSFDCIASRSCKLGSPAIQLEQSVEILKRSMN